MRLCWREIFRSVHTIKGTTGFLGFKRLEKLAHAGENLLGLLRDEKLVAGAAVITALLQLLDGLRAILKAIEAEGNEGAGEDRRLIARLEELAGSGGPLQWQGCGDEHRGAPSHQPARATADCGTGQEACQGQSRRVRSASRA